MTGNKRALLAAILAGGAILTWAVVETLQDQPADQLSTEDALADSPIARMVARMGPPDPATGAAAWAADNGNPGWTGWNRAAADLRAGGDLTGNSDGELGYLRGRSFWDGDPDLDGADGRHRPMRGLTAARTAGPGERGLRGHPYRVPRTGKPTILTSGRRLGRPDMRLPNGAAASLDHDGRDRVPVRVEVCVDRNGRPQEVEVVEGSGVEAVDTYVARELMSGRYRPLRQDGRPVAFCERTTIILGS
jgi:hypothetical protein